MAESQVVPIPNHKPCTKCGKDKPLDEFYDNPRGKYGKDGWCKSCKKGRNHRLLIQRKAYKSPQTLARRAVNNALKKGIIKKPLKCVRCGVETNGLSGHHTSYDPKFWLAVRWLCRVCHDIEDHPGTEWVYPIGPDGKPLNAAPLEHQFAADANLIVGEADDEGDDDEALSVSGEGDELFDGEDGGTSG